MLSGVASSDEGLVKILLEAKLDFNIASPDEDFQKYDVLILPDSVCMDPVTAMKYNRFISQGGGLILSGTSGMDMSGKSFAIDNGLEYIEESPYDVDYMQLRKPMQKGIVKSPFLFYESSRRVRLKKTEKTDNVEILADIFEPYFSRTYGKYCSHQNTPYRTEPSIYPAIIRKGRVIYFAHQIFRQYHEHGAQFHRDTILNALRLIYTNPVMRVSMPSAGRTRLICQREKCRYILHLLYASPIQRGRTLVIEDLPPLYNIPVELAIPEKVLRVKLVPGRLEIPYKQMDSVLTLQVPELICHQIVVLEY